jgi:hypothetical protein
LKFDKLAFKTKRKKNFQKENLSKHNSPSIKSAHHLVFEKKLNGPKMNTPPVFREKKSFFQKFYSEKIGRRRWAQKSE